MAIYRGIDSRASEFDCNLITYDNQYISLLSITIN
jgi:hypothetical protein